MNAPPWNELLWRILQDWEFIVFGAAAAAVLTSVAFRFVGRLEEGSDPVRREKNIAATLTMLLFFLAVYAIARTGFGRAALDPAPLLAAKLTGCVLVILGAVVNIAARYVIGRFWSDQIEIQPGHRVIRAWPYTWMRHPMYGSLVLFGLGLAYLSANPLVAGAVLLVFLPVMARRARREEANLLEACGDEYAEFQRHTPMIVPHFPEDAARWLRLGIGLIMVWSLSVRSLAMFGLAATLTLLISFAMRRPDFRLAYKLKMAVILPLMVLAAWKSSFWLLLWIPAISACMSVTGQCPLTLILKAKNGPHHPYWKETVTGGARGAGRGAKG